MVVGGGGFFRIVTFVVSQCDVLRKKSRGDIGKCQTAADVRGEARVSSGARARKLRRIEHRSCGVNNDNMLKHVNVTPRQEKNTQKKSRISIQIFGCQLGSFFSRIKEAN